MERSEQSDAVLALKAQNGSRQAFDHLVLRHKTQLFRIARHYVGNSDDASDILQETFVAAWLALKRYDSNRNFATWLRTIALNKCRDFSRRQNVRRNILRFFSILDVREASAPSAEANLEREQTENQRLLALDAAIATLPPTYKQALILTAFAGLSQQEAAVQLGTSAKAIEMKVRRAKQRLEEAVKRLNLDEA
ncbi:MAG: RNA polymerase sigma factor [Rhodospirillaceae bacterium]|nr:RNA polymerase sigma factor [Rhodospirillaceae bacterium]